MSLEDPKVFTPYSSVIPLVDDEDVGMLNWVPELDRERILAYQKYEEIYWSHSTAFELKDVTADGKPLFLPTPMTICDTTSHFYMKGLTVTGDGALGDLWKELDDRETVIAKFMEAKHSGVVRGDFLLHITADPTKPEGTRVSVNSLDPAMYFPEFDPDDLNRILAVNIIELQLDELDPTKTTIRRQRYSYQQVGDARKVVSQQAIYEPKGWWKGQTQVQVKSITTPFFLPDPINTIPVYAWKNKPWQGQPFGSSEIRGHENLQARINQSATDEDVALSLEGLGVYATDAPKPTRRDSSGQETEVAWVIAPAMVLEVPTGSYFRRVEGLKSVEPFQSHIKMLTDSVYEATATFRPSEVDAQVAASGIALAIKFLPTMAKLEERDIFGVGVMKQLTFDLANWWRAYEGANIADTARLEVVLGDKLPENKTDRLNVLNNMLDRKAITKEWYRQQVGELFGIEIPEDMDAQLEAEQRAAMELMQEFAPPEGSGDQPPPGGNQSNNRSRPNESGGTEAK